PAILFFVSVESDERFRFMAMSPAGLAAIGMKEEQVIGKLVQEVIPPASVNLVLQNYKQSVRTRTTVRWEEQSEYPAGVKYGDVAITPIIDVHGHVTHLCGSETDITERKRREDDLRAGVEARDD